ncbi:hypothetical protein [uncultured Parasphingorhabdus sp.]|uniref:hypothetical protein n=1 Tax=uncultured Parasphingorhabdus sp. TaxID=2709694 RepID=UPI003749CB26
MISRTCGLVLCSVALAGCAAQMADVNWSLAGRDFSAGEAVAPMVFDRKDASRCAGLWMLHGDAVDDGAFSLEAHRVFPEELRLPYAVYAARFFGEDGLNEVAYREAADRAESQLRKLLAGDRKAFRRYFDALGRCSTKAEAVGDEAGDAIDAPAGG